MAGIFDDEEQSLIDDFEESSRNDAINSFNEQSALDGSDGGGGGATFVADVFEGISLTGDTPSGTTPLSTDNYTVNTGGYELPSGTNTAGTTQSSVVSTLGIAPGAKPDKTWTDGFREFIKTNQSDLLKLGFAAVQGMATESSKQKTAAAQAQSQIDQITLKDKLEQDKTKRIGDSIKGLAPVKKWGGNLKRTDGSSVFQPTGLINMGGKV